MSTSSIQSNPPFVVHGLEVSTLRIPYRPLSGIAAFAIDSPSTGQKSVGAGVEINGWVIGRDAPVQSVRTVSEGRQSRPYPLDVVRPDVAVDYPAFAHAGASGFSAWASFGDDTSEWRFAVEAILENGDTVTLAEIAGQVSVSRRCGWNLNVLPVTKPDFVIIGAQRGGTTSLHAYLSALPQVRTPETKELHYLTDRHERGLEWYLDQYPFALAPGMIAGEATPYALFHPLAPERLRQIAPRAKLIVLLRNPADRAYSHYLLERLRGFEPLDFPAALDAEANRLAGEEARLVQSPAYVSNSHKHASYLARGHYAPQLERWFAAFPREQFLILRSEDLYERPEEVLSKVQGFLEISPNYAIPFAAHNRSVGPSLDPAMRRQLMEHFAPKNARLARLLGRDVRWD